MAISITAEQKCIKDLFNKDEEFIIPSYQRPYSWEEDNCSRLLEDIKSSYNNFLNEGYFLGNIILAKNSSQKNIYEVIDGQQRLITLSLFLKVLYKFDEENDYLRDAIWIVDRRDKGKKKPRIVSKIFENNDGQKLKIFFEMSSEELDNKLNNNKKKDLNKFERNYFYFLNEIKNDKEFLRNFADYILDMLFLLPIQTEEKDQEDSREKALLIFETINNTGLNLSDADIFKSHLYISALNERQEEKFIVNWAHLINRCKELDITILELFRIYSHILRGKEKNKDPEISLRVFFSVKGKYSLQEIGRHESMFLEFDRIIKIIVFVKEIKDDLDLLHGSSECSKWLQLVFEYSNQFPVFATYVYLYKNLEGIKESKEKYEEFASFLKDLIRYCYYKGATSTVKFEIFYAIAQVSHGEKAYFTITKDMEYDFNYLGRLKHSLALLAFYLDPNSKPIRKYYFDKIITSYDNDFFDLEGNRLNDEKTFLDSLGNIVVSDLSSKKRTIEKKTIYYQQSEIPAIKNLQLNGWTYNTYATRNEQLKKTLINFFKGN